MGSLGSGGMVILRGSVSPILAKTSCDSCVYGQLKTEKQVGAHEKKFVEGQKTGLGKGRRV